MFGHRTQVGIVDGLTHVATPLAFAHQSQSQHAVGTPEITQGHVDITQSVERFYVVFLGLPTGIVAFFA